MQELNVEISKLHSVHYFLWWSELNNLEQPCNFALFVYIFWNHEHQPIVQNFRKTIWANYSSDVSCTVRKMNWTATRFQWVFHFRTSPDGTLVQSEKGNRKLILPKKFCKDSSFSFGSAILSTQLSKCLWNHPGLGEVGLLRNGLCFLCRKAESCYRSPLLGHMTKVEMDCILSVLSSTLMSALHRCLWAALIFNIEFSNFVERLIMAKNIQGEKKLKLLYSPMCQVCGYPHSHSSLIQHSDWDVIFNLYYFVFLHFWKGSLVGKMLSMNDPLKIIE